MPVCVLSIEQGTTLTPATVYNDALTCLAIASQGVGFFGLIR